MASRAERKAAARERRLAQEQAAAAQAFRRRRWQALAGVVAVAAVVVAVAIVLSIGGGRGAGPGGGLRDGAASRTLTADVTGALAGIPQHGTTLGDARAPVTLTFYGDLECPICAAFATGTEVGGLPPVGGLPQFIATQVRSGHAKIVYRSMCTATCGDFSNGSSLFAEQQTAAYAAGEQNRFWDYEQLFYRQQGPEGSPYMTPAFLAQLARQTPGLDVARWDVDRGSAALADEVQRDNALAVSQLPLVRGERGTPGLIMSGPRGQRFVAETIVDVATLDAALDAVS